MMLKAPNFWQEPDSWQSRLLGPIGKIWSWGGWCHQKLAHSQRLSVPVISVGNVTLGGGGKTPLVAYLASQLNGSAIVTRGYGKKPQPKSILVDTRYHTSLDVGDEPLLLAKIAPTWISSQRYEGGCAAIKQGARLLILDDAHQHFSLYKNISLLVVDGQLGWGNKKVFPAGPLRESLPQALARCTALIIIGPDQAGIEDMVRGCVPVFKANIETPFKKGPSPKPWAAFAGIAYPQKFLKLLRQLEIDPVPFIIYSDHHSFSFQELEFLNYLSRTYQLLTTEKDWVRLPKTLQEKITFVPIHLTMQEPENFHSFLQKTLQKT